MTGGLTRRASLTIIAVILVLGVGFDQATKALAVRWLTGQPPVRLVSDLLQLTLVRNPGAAFSTGAGATVIFSCLAFVAIVALCVWVVPKVRARVWAIGVGLALAGITGNFIDRLVRSPGFFRGHVVDFVSLKYFAVFNVADMALTAAAILVIIASLGGKGLGGAVGLGGDGAGDDGAGEVQGEGAVDEVTVMREPDAHGDDSGSDVGEEG